MLQTARYLNFLVFIHFRMKFFGKTEGRQRKMIKNHKKCQNIIFPRTYFLVFVKRKLTVNLSLSFFLNISDKDKKPTEQ